MSDETETLWTENSEASAMYAVHELHNGRIEGLAKHIRCCDFNMHPLVARKLVGLIEGSDGACHFALQLVRRPDLPPAFKDPRLTASRNMEMACEVARLCDFKRGHVARACATVGKPLGLKPDYVKKCVLPYKQFALDQVEEERGREAYARGERDFLGRPICPETTFAGESEGE